MVIVVGKNGTKIKIKINKDIIEEMMESSKVKKDIDMVFISRIINTPREKDKAELKDLCTKYQIDVDPLNRRFTKNKVFIRENNLEDAFKKLIILKTRFKY